MAGTDHGDGTHGIQVGDGISLGDGTHGTIAGDGIHGTTVHLWDLARMYFMEITYSIIITYGTTTMGGTTTTPIITLLTATAIKFTEAAEMVH